MSLDHDCILLIHPGALGDLVQATPAFAAVRERFPGARLTLAVGDDVAAAVSELSIFDALHTFDAKTAYRGAAAARVGVFSRLAYTLRAQRASAVGVFKAAPVYAALAAASGARTRVGLTRGWGSRLLTHPLQIDATRHREDQYLDVSRALGARPERAATVDWPAVALPPAFAEARRNAASSPAKPTRFVAVGPGGARNAKQDFAAKRWPAARYAESLIALADRVAVTAVLLGGPGDRGEGDALLAALHQRVAVVDLIGATTIVTARAVIAACDAYLGNDSALMHVAGTTTTPVVAVFGPTDPRVLAPRDPRIRTIWRPVHPWACVNEVAGRATPCAPVCCIDRVAAWEVVAALTEATSGPTVATPGSLRP